MADDLERASLADVTGESTDDKHPIDVDVGLFGARATEAIVADLDGESLAEDDQQEVDDDGAPTRVADADSGVEPIGGYRAEWRPSGGGDEAFDSNDVLAQPDADAGPQLIGGGYRAEWRPSGGASDGVSDTFDPTDLRAGADVSYGAGATDATLRIRDDVKYSDEAAGPWGDGPHDIDIGGSRDEPTEYFLGPAEPPAEPGDGAVTEVSDTDALLAATDSTKFEDVD